ncbi:MAG: GNAT family N-acetyltransferase [Methanobacteriota archaeon]|nr:MAG: GNAT family N-acetyltransferase [Euryarchaeota archaeon]
MKIRLARLDDLPEVMKIENACFGQERFDVNIVRALLTRRNSFTLVAEECRETVGAAMCSCSVRSAHGRIASVAVLPEHRNMGVGSKLITACEEEFRRRGVTRFTLEVAVDNATAVRTYLANGYRIVSEISDYYSRGRSAYNMEKDVTMEGRRTKVRVS